MVISVQNRLEALMLMLWLSQVHQPYRSSFWCCTGVAEVNPETNGYVFEFLTIARRECPSGISSLA